MNPDPLLPRMPYEELSADVKAMHDTSMAVRGDATFFEVSANAPELLDWYVNSFYGKVFYSGRLPQSILELARLRLSMTHGCKFCNQGNREAARAAGVSDAQIDAIDDWAAGPFSEAEKAVLALADQMVLTNEHGALTPDIYAALKDHFTDGQIYELGMVMGILAGVAKFLFAFDLVEREETCPFPGAR